MSASARRAPLEPSFRHLKKTMLMKHLVPPLPATLPRSRPAAAPYIIPYPPSTHKS
jgi:hypothetical protein